MPGSGVKRILVVDDEEPIRLLLRRLLSRALPAPEHEVAFAPSAEAAAAMLREAAFDLVITDYRMGKMTGVELLGVVNRSLPGARTVLMTGYNEESIMNEAGSGARVDAFVKKPWDNPKLLEVLKGLLSAS